MNRGGNGLRGTRRGRQLWPLGRTLGMLLLVTLLGVGLPSPAWGQRLVPVADGVYVFSTAVNSGVIVTERGVVVVDTQISPALARRLLAEIRRVTDRPLAYVINTHYHGDHTYGNSVFAPQAPIIGHQRTPGLMRAREGRMKDFYDGRGLPVRSFPVVLPTLTFSDRLTLRLGEDVIELRHLGKTETDDAIIVYLPRRGVLFAGDTVRGEAFPMLGMPNMAEGLTMEGEWPGVLEQIERMRPKIVVPGHGPVLRDLHFIARQRALMDDLIAAMRPYLTRGTRLEEIKQDLRLPLYADLPQTWGSLEFAIERLYRSDTGWLDPSVGRIPSAAPEDIARAVARSGGSPQALLAEARGAAEQGHFPLALGLADAAIAHGPDRAGLYAAKADLLWEAALKVPSRFDRGDYVVAARRAIEDALRRDPREPLARLHRALDLLALLPLTGQPPDETLVEIRASLAAGLPQRAQARAYYGLGLAHRAKGESQEAREAFQRALALEPGLAPAREALATLPGQ